MGAHIDSAVSRLEVIEVGRRRRWSDAEKLRIVAESMVGRRQVAATARRHGITRWQLSTWRRQAREGRLLDVGDMAADAAPTFSPVVITPDAVPTSAPLGGPQAKTEPAVTPVADARIEIVLGNGRRLLVCPDADPAALARLADALDPR